MKKSTAVVPTKKIQPSSFDLFSNIGEDVISMIVKHLVAEPKHLLYLSYMNKYLFKMIHSDQTLWLQVLTVRENERFHRAPFMTAPNTWSRTMTEQIFSHLPTDLRLSPVTNFRVLPTSRFFVMDSTKLSWPPRPLKEEEKPLLAKHAQKIAYMDHGLCCSMCGHRYKHFPVWELNKRLCDMCLRDNILNSNDLYLVYGVDFWQLFKTEPESFRNISAFLVEPHSSTTRYIFSTFTWTHLQNQRFQKPHTVIPTPSVFFWRPHFEKVFDLQQLKQENEMKEQHAQRLCAHVRALYVRLLLYCRGIPWNSMRKLLMDASKKKLITPSRSELYFGIQRVLSGKPHGLYLSTNTLQIFLDRFMSRRTIVHDHNKRKILELLRNVEAGRVFNYVKITVPGVRHANYNLTTSFRKMMEGN